MVKNIVLKIKTFIKMMKYMQNWHIYLIDFYLNKEKVIPRVYKMRDGTKFRISSGFHEGRIIKEIFFQNEYCPKGFEIKKNDIVVDIGGHVGIFSIFASQKAKEGKVYAFEPIPQSFKLLRQNIEENEIRNVFAINKAVSNKIKKIPIYLAEEYSGSNSIYDWGVKDRKKVYVECMTLPDFIKSENMEKIDFLKIDCEGGEYDILFNMPEKLFEKIEKISAEIHNLDEENNIIRVKKFLNSRGYDVSVRPNLSISDCIRDKGVTSMLYAKRR